MVRFPQLALMGVIANALAGSFLPLGAQDGFQLRGDRVQIGATDWPAWEAPDGVRVIDSTGTVTPQRLRRGINAALNAGAFRYVSEGDTLTGGIIGAGTNRDMAEFIIDGDDNTWWEPELGSGVDNWWIDIDLGRVVVATRVVVRFADEGDPFLTFRVLLSDGRVTFTGDRAREFYRVGLANLPNKEQREFVFDIEPRQIVQEGLAGEVAHILRIQALDTDGPRGAAVDSTTFAELPAEERGSVDYFRRTSAGRQIRVDQDVYDALPPDEQGDVVTYRQERPRLAEVEIYSLGDNAVRLTRPPLETRRLTAQQNALRPFTDGLFSTYGFLREYDAVRDEHQVVLDLGARFWLDRVRLLSPENPPLTYQLRLSDGARNPDGDLVWQLFDERLNREAVLQLEENFPLQPVRYIDLRRLQLLAGLQEGSQIVGEIQALGEGFVSDLTMVSPLMELGRSRLFTAVEWDGDAPLGTRIEVRTRTGDDIIRVPHYFTPGGSEITETTWLRRSEDRRGPIVIEDLPGADWSDWSEVYRTSGEAFKSPAPRTNVIVEVRLLSEEPLRAATLRSLSLRFAPPLVDRAFAEIWPARVQPGRESAFTLYLQPRFGVGNPGFDRIRLRSSSQSPLHLLSVREGTQQLVERGGGVEPGGLVVVPDDGEGVELQFPQAVRRSTTFAVRFRTQVFLGNTQFFAELTRSDLPTRVQQVSGGDVTERSASQSMVVIADLGQQRSLLGDVEVSTPVITPNGDGVNDEAVVELTVFALEGSKRLTAQVFDLGGRRVRDLSTDVDEPSGRHRIVWDGRDSSGRLSPPGAYVARIGLDTDADGLDTFILRVLHLAY